MDKMKKVLNDLPTLGFGAGVATAGASLAVIGVQGIKKNFYMSSIITGAGAWAAHFGTQVALGSIDRMRGLQ